MGARDSFIFQPRGLATEDAMQYLGVKRRTFESLKTQLTPVRLGTSLVYDVRELDELFDRLKRNPAPEDQQSTNQHEATKEAQSSEDRRPTSEKGVSKWVVKVASTKTPKAERESTASTAVSAFKAVSIRIKKQKSG